MAHGHTQLPGSDLLSPKLGAAPSHNKDIFVVKHGGGAGRRRQANADAHPVEEAHGPEPVKEEKVAQQEPTVILTHPKWGEALAHFDEKIKVSVEGRPPPDQKDLTRVEFAAFLLLANGEKDDKPIAKGEGHLKDGKAECELELLAPEAKPGEKASEKAPEKSHVVFTAKHSRSNTVESPKIEVGEAPEFEGMIFYSPSREEYLVLETEQDWKGWSEHIGQLEALKGRTEKVYGIADPVERQKELADVGADASKLFGKKTLGRTSGVLEELLLVKGSRRFGKCNSWVHVAPYMRKEEEVAGHWKKNDDRVTQKRLDKLLKQGKFTKETTPLFEKKAKVKLFNGAGPEIGQWPWRWKTHKTAGKDDDHFTFTADAAVCRYMIGWDGVESGFDLKNKKVKFGTGGQASFGVFEGQISMEVDLPDKDGINLLEYARSIKGVDKFISENRECRLRLHMSAAGSTFVGGTVSAALALPNIDFSDPAKLEGDAGVEAAAFAGAQAKGKLSIGVQWSSGKVTDYKPIGEVAPEAAASAGIGAEFKWKVEYSKDRFRFIASAGLAIGLGCRGGFNFDLNLHEGVKFIGHLMNSVDFHKVMEITEEAYETFANCSFTLMVKGARLVESGAQAASEWIEDIDAWLFTRKSDMTAPKRNLLEASAHRSELRLYPPEALGKSLIALMATREEADFKAIMWILYSADSAHKLKWILRIASQDPFRSDSVAEGQRKMADALLHGIGKIRAFGVGPDSRTPRTDFINEFNALLKAKGIDG